MVKILGVNEPYADTIMKKWGFPWENILVESDKLLLESGEFLLFEKGGKIFFEAPALVFENGFKMHLEAGRPEFLFWHHRTSQKPSFHVLNDPLLLETGDKIVLNYPYGHSSFGIYQRRPCREGKISCKSKFYNDRIPATPARLVCQSKFAAAVAAWKLLTPEQKILYNRRAVGRYMSGYNLFIKNYLNT